MFFLEFSKPKAKEEKRVNDDDNNNNETTMMKIMDDTNSHLTEYEKERNARVMRNERLMQSLGLSSFDVHMHAFKKGGEKDDDGNTKKKKKRKAEREEMRKTKNTTTNNDEPVAVRSSSRLRGEKATMTTTTTTRILNDDDNEEEEREELMIDEEIERKHLIAEKAFLSLRNKSKQKKQTIVGTASYQHTLMRVRTMTEPKLRNRMKAISRAKGQHCVTKMRLFARILFLEGYEELAEECAEELKELIEILGDAKDDETREVETEQEQDGEDFDGDDNKENEEEKHSFHCGQITNLDDPQIFKLVVEIESQARTNEKKEGEKDEDVYHRACVSMSKGKTGMLNKTAAFVLNEDGTYDVIKASEKELNALKTKKKTRQVMYF